LIEHYPCDFGGLAVRGDEKGQEVIGELIIVGKSRIAGGDVYGAEDARGLMDKVVME
jgi:hypothetical protein